MAEDEDSAATADGKRPFRPLDMRTVGKLLKRRSPEAELAEWAVDTLKKADQPAQAGWYMQSHNNGKLVTASADVVTREVIGLILMDGEPIPYEQSLLRSEDPADTPWVARLPIALTRIGFRRDSCEVVAASIIECLAAVSRAIYSEKNSQRRAELEHISYLSLHAGMLWRKQRDSTATVIGRKVSRGGRKSSTQQAPDDIHAVILLENNKLLREGTKSERARARVISGKFGMSFHTVHGILRKYGLKQIV
jgi:hypothetical protein